MKCEKIGIYPFNNDCNVFLQYSDLISSDYRICELASLTGWGLTDKKVQLYSKDYQIKSSLQEFEQTVDSLFVPEFDVSEQVENIIVNEIVNYIPKISKIMCFAKLTDNNLHRLKSECNESGKCVLYYAYENNKIDDNKPYLKNDEVYLEQIDIPIIAVAGMWENTDKFTTSMVLRDKFLKEGYKVTQIGSRKYCGLFGFHSFPDFMLNPEISENKKPLLFNRYIKNLAENEKPDVIIIGVPGSIQSFNEKHTNHFGILPYLVFQSVLVDFLVMCTFYESSSPEFLEEVFNLCKYRLSCEVDVYHMSNLFFDMDEILEKGLIFTNKLPLEMVERTIEEKYSESRLPVINIHQKDSADKLYNMILDKLSNDVKIMI